MRLTPRHAALRDRGTQAQRTSMRLLIALGEIYGADRLIPITSAHIAGASYKMVSDPGLEFIEDFAKDAKVVVPSTVNPLGMDLDRWREQGISAAFAAKQRRIADAYRRMGVLPSFSCTPYLIGLRPRRGGPRALGDWSAATLPNTFPRAPAHRQGRAVRPPSPVTGPTS